MMNKIMKNAFRKKAGLCAALTMLFFSSASVFAVEEYVVEIYRQIDTVFVRKSEADLNTILQQNNKDRFYYLIENYTEKKIRRLIVVNDYDFALSATEVVIENNLDNERAVEMYSTIIEAYEVQKKYDEQQEIAHQKELARIEKEKESKRSGVEKQYVASKTADGEAVYVSGKEVNSSSSAWKASLGLASVSILTEQDSDVTAMNYGICANYTYERFFDKLSVGGDANVDLKFLDLGSGDSKIPLILDFEVLPKIGFPSFFRNLFVRAGFIGMKTGKSSDTDKTDDVISNFYSPSIGFQLEDLKIGKTEFTFNYDYYIGHLYYSDITSAMGVGANLAIPFTTIDQIKLTFNVGVKDKIFVKDNSLENRANIILAIGAENVNR